MNCAEILKGEISEKYLLGHLSAGEQEAYEKHYFECKRCFDELQTYRALQTELKQSAVAIRAESLPKRTLLRWEWAAIAAMVVLIVSLGVWQRQRLRGVGPSQPVEVASHQPPHAPVPSLSELATVEPPPHLPVSLRGSADEAMHKFQQAMRQYRKGNYSAAIPGLRAALKLDPDAIDTRFYLGISYLLTNQTDKAIEELRRTVGAGDSPYFESAHFYLAKAYLRENKLAAAEGELKKTTEHHGSHGAEAARLLEQLQVLRNVRR